jgi:tRNA threonylcarbamoyl adenosine modification protein YeaZ
VRSADCILLAVEASTRAPSCAVLAGGRVFEHTAPAKPVEDLAGLITRTLTDAGIVLADVGQLVVGVGPGSYMGVRAAVSTANALSFAAGLPITGVVSTDALAVLAAPERSSVTVGLHAGRGRVFVARYARAGDRLERDALPVLLGEAEWAAERAGGAASVVIVDEGMPPDASPAESAAARAEPERHPLLASGLLRVYVEQPHLLVAGEPASAVPILPPATIGAGR